MKKIFFSQFTRKILKSVFAVLLFAGCANQLLKYEKVEHLKKIDEFDQQVKIVTPVVSPVVSSGVPVEVPSATPVSPTQSKIGSIEPQKKLPSEPKESQKKKKKKIIHEEVLKPVVSTQHEPELEGEQGFIGRRPLKDPFRVNEKIVYSVTYLGMTAGALTMEMKPFVEVNGRKSYQFQMSAETKSIFSSIYTLDDYVVNLIDYETLIPSVFTLHVRESKQLREARYLFDRNKGQVTYWEKKVTEKDGEQEKKLQWEAPDYTQNVFSAVQYMRVFSWEVGTEHAFRVADDGQNLVFHAKAIRKEKIKVDAGEFDTIVLNPQVQLRGVAKPMGDIFVWLSDDDRKYIIKIEGKIKIGTLVLEADEIKPGID